jgi:hypothetical protein
MSTPEFLGERSVHLVIGNKADGQPDGAGGEPGL